MAVSNSRTLRWAARRICFSVSAANQRSTILIQEALVGVKCVDSASSGAGRGRLSLGLGSLRNDFRHNILFTTYNTLKLVTERRNLRPLRKSPSIDSNLSGLDWLSSLPTGKTTSSSAPPRDLPTSGIQ